MLAKVKKHWIAILVLLLVVIDQIAKGVVIEFLKEESIVLIPNILTLKIVKNTGGAFGVGEGNVTMFVLTNFVVLGIIIRFLITQKEQMDRKTQIVLSMILVGGFSNLISWVAMVGNQYKTFRKQGNSVIDSLRLTNAELKSTGQGFLSLIPTTVKVVGGLAGLVGSSALAYKSMEDLREGSIGTGEAVVKLGGSIAGAAASGALIGSVIPRSRYSFRCINRSSNSWNFGMVRIFK